MFVLNGAIAYVASLSTVFALYPYRDYVKMVTKENYNKMNLVEHSLWRYRGMMSNYSQPLLLATPWALLYAGFTALNGNFTGALLGGTLFGVSKTAIRTVSSRMSGAGIQYSPVGRRGYSSVMECIRVSGTQFGPLSFVCGSSAAVLIAVCWHGATLATLRQNEHNSSFGSNFVEAFRAHAGLTFLTNPLRNTLSSGMFQRERPGGVKTLKDFFSAEKQVFKEGAAVFSAALRTEGISFFLGGTLRTIFKSSLPFGVTYALFKSLGGTLGPRGGRDSGGHGHGYHHPRVGKGPQCFIRVMLGSADAFFSLSSCFAFILK
eukprot:gene4178-3017_t